MNFLNAIGVFAFEHAVGEASDVACDGMTCVVFGNTLRQEVFVVLPDRFVERLIGSIRP
jgi:hypothetical protein